MNAKYAHYTTTGRTKYITISDTPRPVGQMRVVSGKIEARKIAKEHNATPWNF